jgi:hypothetical protein
MFADVSVVALNIRWLVRRRAVIASASVGTHMVVVVPKPRRPAGTARGDAKAGRRAGTKSSELGRVCRASKIELRIPERLEHVLISTATPGRLDGLLRVSQPRRGPLAQLVERHVYTVDVVGSIPAGPTTEEEVPR